MIYFISDAHLGSHLDHDPLIRERKFVQWLEYIRKDATILYLLGDIFDFWFEYRSVVPKGFTRVLGKLAEMVDSGIEVHFFTGNHDMWTFGYFEKEIGMKVHRKPTLVEHYGQTFFLAHGDGLLKKEKQFSILRKIFHSRFLQQMFMILPPFIGQNLGYLWSKQNRLSILHLDNSYKGENEEELIVFAKQYIENKQVNYLVFGHRHIDIDLQLKGNSRVLILGDFISIYSYAVFDGASLRLDYFA